MKTWEILNWELVRLEIVLGGNASSFLIKNQRILGNLILNLFFIELFKIVSKIQILGENTVF